MIIRMPRREDRIGTTTRPVRSRDYTYNCQALFLEAARHTFDDASHNNETEPETPNAEARRCENEGPITRGKVENTSRRRHKRSKSSWPLAAEMVGARI
jgi:hypothetical protein